MPQPAAVFHGGGEKCGLAAGSGSAGSEANRLGPRGTTTGADMSMSQSPPGGGCAEICLKPVGLSSHSDLRGFAEPGRPGSYTPPLPQTGWFLTRPACDGSVNRLRRGPRPAIRIPVPLSSAPNRCTIGLPAPWVRPSSPNILASEVPRPSASPTEVRLSHGRVV